jgi:hypothetical protein
MCFAGEKLLAMIAEQAAVRSTGAPITANEAAEVTFEDTER